MDVLYAMLWGVLVGAAVAWGVCHDRFVRELSRARKRLVSHERMTLLRLQTELRPWVQRNFGRPRPAPDLDTAAHALLGVSEEVGELSHAHLKQTQGIRGDAAKHEADAKDAIGDILVYLTDYTDARGWDIEAILHDTWTRVSQRDWIKYPTDGLTE